MAEQTSIWKKEIHLRRSRPATPPVPTKSASDHWETPKRTELWEELPKERAESTAAAQPDVVAPTSIWKKEITLGKKPKPAKVAAVPSARPKAEAEKTSIWKKEITLAKKPKAAEVVKVPPAPKVEAEKTSIWKKEISLGKKPKATEVPTEAKPAPIVQVELASDVSRALSYAALRPAPEPVEAQSQAEQKQSIWKKEITLRKPRVDVAEPSAMSEAKIEHAPNPIAHVEPVIELIAEPAPEPAVVEVDSAPQIVAPAEMPQVVAALAPAAPTVEPPEPVVEPAPAVEAKPSIWKKELKLRGERAHKPERAPKAAKPPKPPKAKRERESALKRELHMPRGLQLRREPKSGDVMDVLGLRIGSSQLAAALVHNNGSAELMQFARAPLERGLVSAGEVRDPEALAKALKQFFAKHKLPRRGVRLGVATNRIGVRVIEMPLIEDPKLLANAIRFRAQEVVPIPLAEAVLDHVVLSIDAATDKQRVLLVFAHRELVDGYLDACKRAGLKLAGIDFDAFALLRALSDGAEPSDVDQAALIAVSIGHERTIFAVSAGSVCDFARVLDWGGSSLDSALAKALDVPLEEAEALKQELSLSNDARNAGLSPIRLEAARAALRQELQVLGRELMSSLQFYQSRPESLDIGEVLLTGGGAELDGLDVELGKELGVPVHKGDPLRRVTFAKGLERPEGAASLAIAVGLGIEA